MLVLVKALSGNSAYPQPSSQLVAVSTANTATATAIARLWASTQAAIVASKNTITVTVVCHDNSEDDNVHAKHP